MFNLFKNKKEDKAVLKAFVKGMGRASTTERILMIMKNAAKKEDYMTAIQAAGKIKAILEGNEVDSFWTKESMKGYDKEVESAKHLLNEAEKAARAMKALEKIENNA